MTIRPELLDEILKECTNPSEILGEGGVIKQLAKAIIERGLEKELEAIWDMPNTDAQKKALPTLAMERAENDSKAHKGPLRWRSRATARPASNHT